MLNSLTRKSFLRSIRRAYVIRRPLLLYEGRCVEVFDSGIPTPRLATVICEARQAWSVPCYCISANRCASAALRRLSGCTSLLVPSLPSNCCEMSELFAVAFWVLAARYWPRALRQSGETESAVSITLENVDVANMFAETAG